MGETYNENGIAKLGNGILPTIQLTLRSDQLPRPLRFLNASHVSKLLKVSGIVTSAKMTCAKAVSLCYQCTVCHTVKRLVAVGGAGQIPQPPRPCDGMVAVRQVVNVGNPTSLDAIDEMTPCKNGKYIILPERSTYID